MSPTVTRTTTPAATVGDPSTYASVDTDVMSMSDTPAPEPLDDHDEVPAARSGEWWFELIPDEPTEIPRDFMTFPAQAAEPEKVDARRASADLPGQRPSFRPAVAAAVLRWLRHSPAGAPAPTSDAFDDALRKLVVDPARGPADPKRAARALTVPVRGWHWRYSRPPITGHQLRMRQRHSLSDGRLRPREDEVKVSIDEYTYPARLADGQWNGWCLPAFRREVAQLIGVDSTLLAWQDRDGWAQMYWDGDVLIIVDPLVAADPCESPQRLTPGNDARWLVGAYAWTWHQDPSPHMPIPPPRTFRLLVGPTAAPCYFATAAERDTAALAMRATSRDGERRIVSQEWSADAAVRDHNGGWASQTAS